LEVEEGGLRITNIHPALWSAATCRRFSTARPVAQWMGDKSPIKKAMTSHRTPKPARHSVVVPSCAQSQLSGKKPFHSTSFCDMVLP
jgi:hypothetical protein